MAKYHQNSELVKGIMQQKAGCLLFCFSAR